MLLLDVLLLMVGMALWYWWRSARDVRPRAPWATGTRACRKSVQRNGVAGGLLWLGLLLVVPMMVTLLGWWGVFLVASWLWLGRSPIT